jgi:hypothetical protein
MKRRNVIYACLTCIVLAAVGAVGGLHLLRSSITSSEDHEEALQAARILEERFPQTERGEFFVVYSSSVGSRLEITLLTSLNNPHETSQLADQARQCLKVSGFTTKKRIQIEAQKTTREDDRVRTRMIPRGG